MRIVYMGTGEIGLPTLKWLVENQGSHEVVGVFTQPDKKIGRKQLLTPPEVKVLAEEAGIPVFQPETLRKNESALEELTDLNADVLVVMAYGQILPRRVIEAPSIACVNLHASLLPRHRGASPIQAAIRDGDKETGITLMHVVPKLDAGDMILKEVLTIDSKDTGGILHDRLAEIGPRTMQRGLEILSSGEIPAEPQEEELVTYSGKLEREHGQIDWSADAKVLERLIRAYDPWPGTYTMLPSEEGLKKLKIYPYAEVGADTEAAPGTVLGTQNGLHVSCGKGSVMLQGDLQLEGRRRLSCGDFLRGTAIPEGTRLGNQ